jgi:hypothetical protein
VIAEILADGNLQAFPIGDPPEILARRIGRELGGDSTLQQHGCGSERSTWRPSASRNPSGACRV